MQIQKKKDRQEGFIRIESLGIPLDREDGSTQQLIFQSEEPDYLLVYVVHDNDRLIFVGSVSMRDFLGLCRRGLELWESEQRTE
jgi:hypothetical protein